MKCVLITWLKLQTCNWKFKLQNCLVLFYFDFIGHLTYRLPSAWQKLFSPLKCLFIRSLIIQKCNWKFKKNIVCFWFTSTSQPELNCQGAYFDHRRFDLLWLLNYPLIQTDRFDLLTKPLCSLISASFDQIQFRTSMPAWKKIKDTIVLVTVHTAEFLCLPKCLSWMARYALKIFHHSAVCLLMGLTKCKQRNG